MEGRIASAQCKMFFLLQAAVKSKKATDTYKLYVEKYALAKADFEQKMTETAQVGIFKAFVFCICCILYYLFDRQSDKEVLRICWFTLQVAAVAGAGPGRSPKPGVCCASLGSRDCTYLAGTFAGSWTAGGAAGPQLVSYRISAPQLVA